MNTHPLETELALYAGGDVSLAKRWGLGRHVAKCAICRKHIQALQTTRQSLKDSAGELPDGIKWDRLASEMTANIRLGLEAGECVAPFTLRRPNNAWRGFAAVGALSGLVMAAWLLNMPASQTNAVVGAFRKVGVQMTGRTLSPEQGVTLEGDLRGIEVRENGHALTMFNPRTQPVRLSVSMQGSMAARYVDSDTGQVTITNVYSQ